MAETIELNVMPSIADIHIKAMNQIMARSIGDAIQEEVNKIKVPPSIFEQAMERVTSGKLSKAIQKEVDRIEAPTGWAKLAGAAAGIGSMLLGEKGAGIVGRATTFGAAAGGAVGGLPGGAIAGGIAGAAVGIVGAIPEMVKQLGHFVEAANPAVMEQLNLAFKDITAVIGHALTPVFQALVPLVRIFGDIMVGVTTALKPIISALTGFLEAIKKVIDILGDFGMGLAGTAAGAGIGAMIGGLPGAIIGGLIGGIGGLIGGTSTGAAAGQAKFLSPEELMSDTIRGAYGVGASVQERMAASLEQIDRNTTPEIRPAFMGNG